MKMRIKISLALLVAFLAPITANAFSIVPLKCQGEYGCNVCDVALAFTNAADIIAALLGSVALLFFIIGGFFLILSSGNEQRIETGKKILVGTVTGLAIVFLAWFAVNFTIRVAYQGSNNTTGDASVTVFGVKTSWWSLPSCDPTLSPCAGKYIGEACGTVGDCASGGSGCSCYRPKETDGNNLKEGEDLKCNGAEADAGNISAAGGSKKQCYCASPCSRTTYDKEINPEGKEFVCLTQEVYEVDQSSVKNYIKYDNISCGTPDLVCLRKK